MYQTVWVIHRVLVRAETFHSLQQLCVDGRCEYSTSAHSFLTRSHSTAGGSFHRSSRARVKGPGDEDVFSKAEFLVWGWAHLHWALTCFPLSCPDLHFSESILHSCPACPQWYLVLWTVSYWNLPFPDFWWGWAPFHRCVGHLGFLSCK